MIYIKKWLEHYEELFHLEPNQIEFFKERGKEFSSPVRFLSVECGPAFVCQQLAKDCNFDVTVTDSYPEWINKIKALQDKNQNTVHSFNLNPADISRYLGKDFYNLMYCGNYRLIFMKDRGLIKKFLLDAKYLLAEGGYLILDLINFTKFDFSEPRIDLPVKKSENVQLHSYILKKSKPMKYFLNQQLVTKEGISVDEVVDEEICPISMESFKSFADELGFSSIQFYADYKGNPLTKDSDKIICVLKK